MSNGDILVPWRTKRTVCPDPCVLCFSDSVLCLSLASYEFHCHFLFPSVPSVSGSTPSSRVNSPQVSQISNHPLLSIYSPFVLSLIVRSSPAFSYSRVLFCSFALVHFSSSLLYSFLQHLLWFWFLVNKPFKWLSAPFRVCIWVLLPRLHWNRDTVGGFGFRGCPCGSYLWRYESSFANSMCVWIN